MDLGQTLKIEADCGHTSLVFGVMGILLYYGGLHQKSWTALVINPTEQCSLGLRLFF